MKHTKQLTRYFRQSLIDSERLSPSDSELLPALGIEKTDPAIKDDFIAIDHICWHQGLINPGLTEKIFNHLQNDGSREINDAELVLFPRVDLLKSEGGDYNQAKRRLLLPLVIFVRLQKNGELKPSNKGPWIARDWLNPSYGSTNPIGEMDTLDAFLTEHPFEDIEVWADLVNYCTDMLCTVCNSAAVNKRNNAEDENASIFDLKLNSEYEQSEQSILQIKTKIIGVKAKIQSVLDKLIDSDEYPPLYQSYCNRTSRQLDHYQDKQNDYALAKKHIAQMTAEFPLSVKQRNALHHFLNQTDGEILAVNGPPGTGKTTLLRSIVVNQWAEAALNETEPPIIVAASNNNQAITNILDSFSNANEIGIADELKDRWLPEISSYGLYCCASYKANEKNDYAYLGPDGEGCMQDCHSEEYLKKAKIFFLEKANAWLDDTAIKIKQVKESLHQSLKSTHKEIHLSIDLLEHFESLKQTIKHEFGGLDKLNLQLGQLEEENLQLSNGYQQTKQRIDELYNLWDSRSLLTKILLYFGILRKAEQRKTAKKLNEWDIHLDNHDDDSVEKLFQGDQKKLIAEQQQIKHRLDQLNQLKISYEDAHNSLQHWVNTHSLTPAASEDLCDQVHEINDCVLRFKLFKLTTHYWEARWLIEFEQFIESNDKDKKSPKKTIRKLKRFAKLTPCFVSTFYMTPKTFMAGAYNDKKKWYEIPLFETIDLLIVDESGQALPEVAAATFALAKQALVVGDTDQIEPVWNIPVHLDIANLRHFNLLTHKNDFDEFWQTSGLLASNGNVMSVAQRQCCYHQLSDLQRGLYLTEHRRCYNEIIQYCNKLVYKNLLEPLRGDPKDDIPWNPMSFVATNGTSESFGGSRGNKNEAQAIASWLQSQHQNIIQYARNINTELVDLEESEVLKKVVGIVTPFSKQAGLIRKALSQHGIKGLTVGTIHRLQGGERRLILFSSVYGENDAVIRKFYDRDTRMLNVAVSRAQDVFIVFGNTNIFGTNAPSSPSGLLRTKLVET